MNRHDFSKKDHIKQYPSLWVSSRPHRPKDKTSYDVPHLDLRYETNNIPQPESTDIANENTRAYVKRMLNVVC